MLKVQLIFVALFLCISQEISVLAVLWPCSTNDDCSATGSKCSTEVGLCECDDFETVFSSDFTKCLKTSLFGEECEDTVQCNLMPSGSNCKSGVCDCADGQTYIQGRCKVLNSIGESCDTDLDCYFGYDRESVQCKDKICNCADGYYHRNGNICRRKSMEIDDACVVDQDCDELGQNVKCKSLKCQYDNDDDQTISQNDDSISLTSSLSRTATSTTAFTSSVNRTARLRTEASTASDPTSQISKSSLSKSFDDSPESLLSPLSPVAQEQTQHDQQQQQPQLSLQQTQQQPQQQQRQQQVHQYPSRQQSQLSSSSSIIFGELFNGDNEELLNANSTEAKIGDKEIEESRQQQTRLREIAVQTSLEAFELKSLGNSGSGGHGQHTVGIHGSSLPPSTRNVGTGTTSTSTSSRRASYYRRRSSHRRMSSFRPDDEDKTFSTLSNTDDDLDENKYGSSCTDNGRSCSGLPHSICSNSICLCKQGFYHKNGKCFAELGEIAESADECEHAFDELSSKCICQKNYFYERSLRACRKPIQFHLSCTSNSQCSPFGAAYCHPEIPRRCTCEEYAEYDDLRQMCIYKQGLGAQCESSDGCPVENSICSNRICVCKDNFMQRDDVCVPAINADCTTDSDCNNIENAECATTSRTKRAKSISKSVAADTEGDDDEENKERTCQCRKGYVHFKDECLKEATELEDECIDSEQCKPLLATCIEKKCSCTSEEHFKNGRCIDKKGLNEACGRADECFVEKEPENVECRNSVCQCKFGYQADVEQRACIRVVASKKNSSGRPSALKIITFLLIGSAFLITSAAIKQAYY